MKRILNRILFFFILFFQSLSFAQADPDPNKNLLVRVPARLWGKLFTVRVTLKTARVNLNGRFLVDSTAPKSVVSPSWLTNQGVIPSLIKAPKVPRQPVLGAQFTKEVRGKSAITVHFEQTQLSGLAVSLQDFLLAETDFFPPPGVETNCCDGVLGTDFLELYPIEFQTKEPHELRIWNSQTFDSKDSPNYPPNYLSNSLNNSWIEVSKLNLSKFESTWISDWQTWEVQPQVKNAILGEKASQHPKLGKVRWNTGSQKAFVPARLESKAPFSITDIGMDVLERGSFVFDLPHRRILFSLDFFPRQIGTQPE